MLFQTIAGYKFTPLTDISRLRCDFLTTCGKFEIRGTILLSPEGINVNLAGVKENIHQFKMHLFNDERFNGMTFRESFSEYLPYKRLKVKLKKEIITFKNLNVNPYQKRATSIAPQTLKSWLDEGRDILLLDARNTYEIKFGTFVNAIHFNIHRFTEFSEKIPEIDRTKPIVSFCTSGIRCEKAALLLQEKGFNHVLQLEGGILNYFTEVGGDHYQGNCFVFDDRIALDPRLQACQLSLCKHCQTPLPIDTICNCCHH